MEMSFNSAFQRDLLSWDSSFRSLNLLRFAIRDRLHDIPAGVVHAAEQTLHALLQRALGERPGPDQPPQQGTNK